MVTTGRGCGGERQRRPRRCEGRSAGQGTARWLGDAAAGDDLVVHPPLLPPPPVSTRHLETPGDGYLPVLTCVSSEIRAWSTCSQAEGRQFESGIPLDTYGALGPISGPRSHLYSHFRGPKDGSGRFKVGVNGGGRSRRFSSRNRGSASPQFASWVGANSFPPPLPPAARGPAAPGGERWRSPPASRPGRRSLKHPQSLRARVSRPARRSGRRPARRTAESRSGGSDAHTAARRCAAAATARRSHRCHAPRAPQQRST